MKLIKLSQIAPQNGALPDQDSINQVYEAMNTIQTALASINKSIQTIENSGVSPLFQKNTLIDMIQSGEIQSLDLNKIQDALNAMDNIAKSSATMNNAFRIVNENQEILRFLKLDYRTIQDQAINVLQSGSYAGFEGVLGNFSANLQSQTGLT